MRAVGQAARGFVQAQLFERKDEAALGVLPHRSAVDPKRSLREHLQRRGEGEPMYTVLQRRDRDVNCTLLS